MFRKLHLQLTALCVAITGLVLAVLSSICLFISESGIRRQEYASFLSDLDSLYQNLEQQLTLSHTWIRQTEHNYQIVLRLSDNGVPLFFQSLSEPKSPQGASRTSSQDASQDSSRGSSQNTPQKSSSASVSVPEELWQAAEDTARDLHGIDLQNPGSLGVLTRHAEFPLSYAHRDYNASVALIPRGAGNYIGAIILQPLSRTDERIFRQRAAFVLADLAALALLAIFYWNFTARMIRPLWESRKRQVQFVASASHELRSPLAVILSNVAAVRSGAMPGDEQFLNVIDSEGKRMSRLITDMLQLVSADSRAWSIRPSRVEMDTLLLQIFENYEFVASAHGLRWEIVLPDDPVPPCICDEERIRQLISILVDNAFSYTPAGGHVVLTLSCRPFEGSPRNRRTLRRGQLSPAHSAYPRAKHSRSGKEEFSRLGTTENTRRREKLSSPGTTESTRRREEHSHFNPAENTWRREESPARSFLTRRKAGSADCGLLYIAVSDNGPGIPDDQKETVFERFSRLDKSRSDKSHFGLGLCIAQEIVHLHHGRILLSDTPGGGSTFTVELPLSTEARR